MKIKRVFSTSINDEFGHLEIYNHDKSIYLKISVKKDMSHPVKETLDYIGNEIINKILLPLFWLRK